MKIERALIIQGPEGCGKTTLARVIASMVGGTYVDIRLDELINNPLALSRVTGDDIKVVVVHCEATPFECWLNKVSPLVANTGVMVDIQGQDPEIRPLPNFIFCTGVVEPIKSEYLGRRFMVVEPKGVGW